jgi:hypothetical protein
MAQAVKHTHYYFGVLYIDAKNNRLHVIGVFSPRRYRVPRYFGFVKIFHQLPVVIIAANTLDFTQVML